MSRGLGDVYKRQVNQSMAPQDAASLSTTALAEMEKMTILRVFEQAHGDKALAGKMLGISRATLYRKLKRYNIALRGGSPAEANDLETSTVEG